MASEPDVDPSNFEQAMQDEAQKKIESGEEALDHDLDPEDRSTLPPATESGQQPGEQ
jgi:hypothetical protein